MRNANSPPSYGQAPSPPQQTQQPQWSFPQARQYASHAMVPQGGWKPQAGQAPVGGPQAGQAGATPPSSGMWNAYQRLRGMPITGGGTKRQFNEAANEFAQQYGSDYDPQGMLARTKALRKRYGK